MCIYEYIFLDLRGKQNNQWSYIVLRTTQPGGLMLKRIRPTWDRMLLMRRTSGFGSLPPPLHPKMSSIPPSFGNLTTHPLHIWSKIYTVIIKCIHYSYFQHSFKCCAFVELGINYFKGTVQRDFELYFFHHSNQPGLLINGFKYFQFLLRFRWVIRT